MAIINKETFVVRPFNRFGYKRKSHPHKITMNQAIDYLYESLIENVSRLRVNKKKKNIGFFSFFS